MVSKLFLIFKLLINKCPKDIANGTHSKFSLLLLGIIYSLIQVGKIKTFDFG